MFDTLVANQSQLSSDSLSGQAQQDHLSKYAMKSDTLLTSGEGARPPLKPGEVPYELRGLKKVTVEVVGDAWLMMDATEQANTINYILMREKYFRSKLKIKSVAYTITSEIKENVEEDVLSGDHGLRATAEEHQKKMRRDKGKSALNVGGTGAGNGGLIDVNERTFSVESVEDVVKEEKKSFDAASTFPSNEWREEKMNNANFQSRLEEAVAEVQRLRGLYGEELGLDFAVVAGESQVPSKNYDPGELAKLRSETAIAVTRGYFASKGVDTTNINFVSRPVIGDEPWYERGHKDYKPASDPKYTEQQFLRVEVEMNNNPPPKVSTEEHNEVELVYLEKEVERRWGPHYHGSGGTFGGKSNGKSSKLDRWVLNRREKKQKKGAYKPCRIKKKKMKKMKKK